MGEQLAGKTALVVGASRGIGKGIAEQYADAGANVVVAARTVEDIEAIAADIDGVAVECDVQDTASVEHAVDHTIETFGGLDIVCNSAGIIARNPIHETTETDMQRVLDVNLTGAMRLAKAAIPHLIESAGTYIMISSETGERGVPNLPVYCASKGGMNALTQQLAIEYSDENVTVNAISPGTIKTPINEEVRETDPSWLEQRRSVIPLGRVGEVEDVAWLATYLASDAARHITGEIINVDGGTTAT